MITYASQSQSAAQSRFMQVSQGPSSHPENTKKNPVQKDRALRAIRKISLLFHGLNDFRVDIETVFLIGEAPTLDVFDILTYSIDDGLMKVGIGLDEFRTETAAHTEEVRADQNLTVADITGPDADGSRLLQGFRDFSGNIRRDAFQDDGKGTGFFQSQGFLDQAFGRFGIFPCTR